MSEISLSTKPPMWFWIVSVVALIWNLLGVFAYIAQVMMTPEALAALPADQQAIIATTPAWYTAAFATAVFAGTLGCIALLLRKSWALWLFALSLIAVLAQQVQHFLLTDIGKGLSTPELAMTLTIPVVAILLIWFSRHSSAKDWLRQKPPALADGADN